MAWAEISIVLFISHLVGDFLLQTEWQANHKFAGLGADPVARRALFAHLLTYMLAFVPALVWIGDQAGAAEAIGVAALIFLPHLVIDDGRLRQRYMVRVKGTPDPPLFWLDVAVDQCMHLACLFAVAPLAGALA